MLDEFSKRIVIEFIHFTNFLRKCETKYDLMFYNLISHFLSYQPKLCLHEEWTNTQQATVNTHVLFLQFNHRKIEAGIKHLLGSSYFIFNSIFVMFLFSLVVDFRACATNYWSKQLYERTGTAKRLRFQYLSAHSLKLRCKACVQF